MIGKFILMVERRGSEWKRFRRGDGEAEKMRWKGNVQQEDGKVCGSKRLKKKETFK